MQGQPWLLPHRVFLSACILVSAKSISTRGVAKVNFLSIAQNGRRMCARLEELQRGHHRRGV
jgi:hypothetical protein